MARFAYILLAAGLWLGWSQPVQARATVSTSVKIKVVKLARKGKRAFLAKRYDDALRYYKQAYGLWPKPQLLYNIALAHSRAGRPVPAMSFLRAFFAEAKTQRQKRRVMRRARKLERSLQPQVAVLDLTGPQGARVFLNDKPAGTLPLEAVLRPGPHRLELRAKGRVTVTRSLWLPAGRTTALQIQMRAAPRRTEPRPRPGPGTTPPDRDPGPQKGLHMAYCLGAAGLAVALAGIAVGTGMMAIKRYDEFQDNPTHATRDRVKTLQNATNALWGVAGAVGAAAVVLAIFTRWKRRESAAQPRPRVELGAGPGGLGVAVQGTF